MTLPLRVKWNSLGLTHWKHGGVVCQDPQISIYASSLYGPSWSGSCWSLVYRPDRYRHPSSSDPDGLLDLGLLLLVGPLLLDLEWLLEPDLECEEDIIKVLLAVNRKEIKITTFIPEHDNRSYLPETHYKIKYSRKLQFTIEHFTR